MRVLVIEDDAATSRAMELMFRSDGRNAYTTDMGEEAVDLAKLYDYDLITLDLDLPDMSGFDVLRQIRTAGVKTPVIIVTGDATVESIVRALNSGADDYLTKPFHKDELIARSCALVRRSQGRAEPIITTGPLSVNLVEKRATVQGRTVHLTSKEYGVLELLCLRRGVTLTKDMFLNHLYGGLDEPEPKIIDVFICKLRTKLRLAGAEGLIETVWGRGYVVREPRAEGLGAAA